MKFSVLGRSICSAQQWRSISYSSENARPSHTLRKIFEQMKRKRKPKKNEVKVEVPEGTKWLDTISFPMVAVAIATGVTMKLLMMYDEAHEQERIERHAKRFPSEMGTVRMVTKEEWDKIQEIRPRTPFESRIARPNARLRTGDPVHMDDVKEWSIDVLTDAFTRVEDSVHHNLRGKQ
eukprot:TRINITY_DN36263_c0_g1_i1.p1 TRINITY_DN36263_c0_g1~~TRINITY_DN36263_c0_g1_i1.p1  ORF type:complete len:178 (-),score=18.55 TRINITY_DN36263_c0_g1_i1:73-606(-)